MLIAVKFLYLFSIVVWIGSIVFFSFLAAPSIFKVLPRETAGEVVGDIFPKYWLVGYISSLLALSTLLIDSMSSHTSPFVEIAILVAMSLLCFYTGLVIGPKARDIKADIKKAEPSEVGPLRRSFKRVHAISLVLNMFVLALGLVLIYFTALRLA